MKIQYIITKEEVDRAKQKLYELRQAALLSRDIGEMEDNRDLYLRAKGFEDALTILGVIKEDRRY